MGARTERLLPKKDPLARGYSRAHLGNPIYLAQRGPYRACCSNQSPSVLLPDWCSARPASPTFPPKPVGARRRRRAAVWHWFHHEPVHRPSRLWRSGVAGSRQVRDSGGVADRRIEWLYHLEGQRAQGRQARIGTGGASPASRPDPRQQTQSERWLRQLAPSTRGSFCGP